MKVTYKINGDLEYTGKELKEHLLKMYSHVKVGLVLENIDRYGKYKTKDILIQRIVIKGVE